MLNDGGATNTEPHVHSIALDFDPACDLCQLATIGVRLARANQESEAMEEIIMCLYPELVEQGGVVRVEAGQGFRISIERIG